MDKRPRPHAPDSGHYETALEGGGESWAILSSLINTAKLNKIDPETYLTDVLERIVSGRTKNNQLDELLVWEWKAARETEAIKAAA
jgi:hypothetical protein